ncbi:MAG: type 4a pilus biogenesis protein PilO [Terriglobia bacterium]|jgi:type IV pilus assembly protein PilO
MPKSFNDLPAAVQIAIFVLSAVLVGGAVFYFYVLPLKEQRDSVRNEVDRLTAENKLNQIFEQQRKQYLNRIAQLEKQLDTLRSIVPEEQATDDFMRMVFEDGRASEVNIRTFVPQALEPKDIYTEMPFSLRLDGTYFGLLGFFARLANEQRIVSVSGLSLGPPEGGGMGAFKLHPGETVGANCLLTTYFSRVSTAAPSTPKR